MARGRSSRRGVKSEINIVPLLDVLLVLLLIFMATAPIISQSVEVDLPQATETQTVSTSDNPPVIVEVAKGENIKPSVPLSISVVASQIAITASPVSAAVIAMSGFLEPFGCSYPMLLASVFQLPF